LNIKSQKDIIKRCKTDPNFALGFIKSLNSMPDIKNDLSEMLKREAKKKPKFGQQLVDLITEVK
jgi:hypothetical protein